MRRFVMLTVLWGLAGVAGCVQHAPNSKAVVMLMDTSGTYREELDKARAIINYLLGTLEAGDTFAVAKIDSGSFSEKDIIARVTFRDRPSVTTAQKREFQKKVSGFVSRAPESRHTDISGALLQATEVLKESGARQRYVFIFSDLEEDLEKGHVRNFPLPLNGVDVVALNVTKLRRDNVDPRKYTRRLEAWEKRVVAGGGRWRVVNDFDNLGKLLSH